MRFIPTFDAEGNRLRPYSSTAIERLTAMKRIWVRRNRRGSILCAQFLPRAGDPRPLHPGEIKGQRYSRQKPIGDTRLWQHKDLPPIWRFMRDAEQRDIDRFLRSVFCAVPLEIGNSLSL